MIGLDQDNHMMRMVTSIAQLGSGLQSHPDSTETDQISSRSKYSCKLFVNVKTSDLKTCDQNHFATNMICKLPKEEQSVDQQSTENTHCDHSSNLIPHDKDHAGDPMSFVPIFHSESTR
jgi:hypothetical protein